MRRLYTASSLVALSFMLAAPAWAAEIVASSHITAVTVYPDRAAVVREAVVDVPAGASSVVISGLPATADNSSLRADGKATAPVMLGALESRVENSAEVVAPRERELKSQLQALQDQQAILVADQTALQEKQKFLSTLSAQAAARVQDKIAQMDIKPDQWKAAANGLADSMGETLRLLAHKAVEMRDIEGKIVALQNDLNALQTGATSSYRVSVPVEAKEATRLTMHILYQVSNATWQPLYDARLATHNGQLSVTQMGEVQQQTGEDWSGVKLTLSTAQPAQGAVLPPLESQWVDVYDPTPVRHQKAFGSMADSAAPAPAMMAMERAEAMVASAPAPVQATFQPAMATNNGFVTEYNIIGSSTVLANGTASKVMIGEAAMDSTLIAKVQPQTDNHAYLMAVARLKGDAPLLAGRANLFRDGAFIGTSDLPMLRAGETADLSFGVDDQITVKHSVVKDETGEAGVISKDSTRARTTITEIQNLHKTGVKLVVDQTIPAPRHEKIKLAMDGTTTSGYSESADNTTGKLRWTFDITPQQKQEVRLGWTLSWPKELNISGLPY